MLKRMILAVILTVCASAAAGQADRAPIGKDAFRALILTGDFYTVEKELAFAHKAFLDGKSDANQLRRLFSLFGTTDPKILEFTQRWLAGRPESVFANTAHAWNAYQSSWRIRGARSYRDTYPEALRQFSELQETAWKHAHKAYTTEPRLLPATDALIRLSMATNHAPESFQVLDEVMTVDPNWGSLFRALDATLPQWGGSWRMAQNICDYYAPRLTTPKGDPLEYCLIYASRAGHAKYGSDLFWWAQNTLREGNYPNLDYMRLRASNSHKATRADAAFTHGYLTELLENGGYNYSQASEFDCWLADRFGYEPISEAHYRASQDAAHAALEQNPFDPHALESLRTRRTECVTEGSTAEITTVEEPSAAEEADYVRRQLHFSPYDPQLWQIYAGSAFPRASVEMIEAGEPFMINAIVYSNHSPRYLIDYAASKQSLYHGVQIWQKHGANAEFQSLWEEIDTGPALICPMARAYRLHEHVCSTRGHYDCQYRGWELSEVKKTLKELRAYKMCPDIYAARIKHLYFEPVAVEFPEVLANGG